MTVLLDQAISDLVANYGIIYQIEEEPVLREVDEETWDEVREYRTFLDGLDYQRCLDELEKMKNHEGRNTNK